MASYPCSRSCSIRTAPQASFDVGRDHACPFAGKPSRHSTPQTKRSSGEKPLFFQQVSFIPSLIP